MSRLLTLGLATFSLMAAFPVFASDDCSCDQNCAEECSKGTGAKTCQCKDKDCECAKGKGCKHGKCHTKGHHSE